MDLRPKFDMGMVRLRSDDTEKLTPERRKKPTFDLRNITNLMRALGENKKCLLRQITSFCLALGQGECEPVQRRVKASDNYLEI